MKGGIVSLYLGQLWPDRLFRFIFMSFELSLTEKEWLLSQKQWTGSNKRKKFRLREGNPT